MRNKLETFLRSLLEVISLVQQLLHQQAVGTLLPPQDLEQRFTPLALFHSEIGAIKVTVLALEKRVEVSFGGFTFKNLFDCKQFLTQHCPQRGQTPIYHCMSTLNSLLQAIGDEVVMEKESLLEELTQRTTGKTVAQSGTIASQILDSFLLSSL